MLAIFESEQKATNLENKVGNFCKNNNLKET